MNDILNNLKEQISDKKFLTRYTSTLDELQNAYEDNNLKEMSKIISELSQNRYFSEKIAPIREFLQEYGYLDEVDLPFRFDEEQIKLALEKKYDKTRTFDENLSLFKEKLSENPKYYQYNTLREAERGQKCPIRDEQFGGIPKMGGFKTYTNYSTGLGKLIESLRRIIGILNRASEHEFSLKHEKMNLLEQNMFIMKFLKNYSKGEAHKELFNKTYDSKVVQATSQNIREASQRLLRVVSNKLECLSTYSEELPAEFVKIAEKAYNMMYIIAAESVQMGVEENIYKSGKIFRASDLLSNSIKEISTFKSPSEMTIRTKPLKETDNKSEMLYHVTYLANIEDIAYNGLQRGSGQTFGGGYATYSTGKVFLASWRGVRYWFGKYEDFASDKSDNPIEDALIPIVLRVDVSGLELQNDDIGTKDAISKSYFIEEEIEPNRIQAYDGHSWKGLEEIDVEQIMDDALEAAQIEDDYGEEIIWPNFDMFRPLSEMSAAGGGAVGGHMGSPWTQSKKVMFEEGRIDEGELKYDETMYKDMSEFLTWAYCKILYENNKEKLVVYGTQFIYSSDTGTNVLNVPDEKHTPYDTIDEIISKMWDDDTFGSIMPQLEFMFKELKDPERREVLELSDYWTIEINEDWRGYVVSEEKIPFSEDTIELIITDNVHDPYKGEIDRNHLGYVWRINGKVEYMDYLYSYFLETDLELKDTTMYTFFKETIQDRVQNPLIEARYITNFLKKNFEADKQIRDFGVGDKSRTAKITPAFLLNEFTGEMYGIESSVIFTFFRNQEDAYKTEPILNNRGYNGFFRHGHYFDEIVMYARGMEETWRLDAELTDMLRTLRHELQHLTQELIRKSIQAKSGQKIRGQGGFPHKYHVDPFVDDAKDHAVRSIEFKTRLSDEIDKFKEQIIDRVLRETGDDYFETHIEYIKNEIKIWTGTVQNSPPWYPSGYPSPPSFFFNRLKKEVYDSENKLKNTQKHIAFDQEELKQMKTAQSNNPAGWAITVDRTESEIKNAINLNLKKLPYLKQEAKLAPLMYKKAVKEFTQVVLDYANERLNQEGLQEAKKPKILSPPDKISSKEELLSHPLVKFSTEIKAGYGEVASQRVRNEQFVGTWFVVNGQHETPVMLTSDMDFITEDMEDFHVSDNDLVYPLQWDAIKDDLEKQQIMSDYMIDTYHVWIVYVNSQIQFTKNNIPYFKCFFRSLKEDIIGLSFYDNKQQHGGGFGPAQLGEDTPLYRYNFQKQDLPFPNTIEFKMYAYPNQHQVPSFWALYDNDGNLLEDILNDGLHEI